MLKILEEPELMSALDEMRVNFDALSKDTGYLSEFFPSIEEVQNWKFSTGAIFDQPPYGAEMAGFNPGKLLKKKYSSPFEAREKGAYSSGFIDEKHVVTIFPSKPADMPMEASFYRYEQGIVKRYSLTIYDGSFCKIVKPPVLRGISHTYIWRDHIKVYIAVGARGAYSINLYCIGAGGLIERGAMVTAPLRCQDEFNFIYDDTGLVKVMSNGTIWERKAKKVDKIDS